MIQIENIPIRRKIIAAIMLTSGAALVLACLAFSFYEFYAFRKGISENLKTLSQVIAANSTGALAFQNEPDAEEVLSALRAEPHILGAALYDQKGKLFATYPPSKPKSFFPNHLPADGDIIEDDHILRFEPVVAEKRLGTLYLESDLRALHERTRLYAGFTGIFLAGAFIIAFIISALLQKRITRPVLDLANTAKLVSQKKDYTVRARVSGKDELGQMAESFNDMLTQIHDRDIALSEKEERLRLALLSARTGVWDWNLVTGILTWDEFLLPMFGITKEEFGGTLDQLMRFIHPEDRQWVKESLDRSIRERSDFFAEYRIVRPDNTQRYILSRGRAFYSLDGKPIRMIGVAADVTERKSTEQALRDSEEKYRRLSEELEDRVQKRTAELATLNQELEAFTYSVSHDLRAPLRHINAYAQLIQEDYQKELSPGVNNHLKRIIDGARNMGRLIDDLLNLARVGKQELARQNVQLSEMVEEVINSMKPETEHRQIEWRVGKLGSADCDPGLIKQVFVNLISNSIKYSRPRDKAIIVIDKTFADQTPVIFVRDNGVGFDMKYASKLFGVFQRLHLSEEFEGTGVGLATVARIIQKHGGKIWAEAEENKGATFYFTFPGLN